MREPDELWLEKYNDLISQGVDTDQAECDASDFVDDYVREFHEEQAEFERQRRIEDEL